MMRYRYLQSCLPNIEMNQEQDTEKPSVVSVVMCWTVGARVLCCCMNRICVSAESLLCDVTSLVSGTLIKPKHDACFT